jgi:hypothetical protein
MDTNLESPTTVADKCESLALTELRRGRVAIADLLRKLSRADGRGRRVFGRRRRAAFPVAFSQAGTNIVPPCLPKWPVVPVLL